MQRPSPTLAQTGNLSPAERATSALFGVALSLLALRGSGSFTRSLGAVTGPALLLRAISGHCAVKSALSGHTSLREGLADQWRHLTRGTSSVRNGLPGSPLHTARSEAVDESVSESFPASDPPASRLPDEPPVNAEAKWEAARAAERRDLPH